MKAGTVLNEIDEKKKSNGISSGTESHGFP
jgi:hypothetical protein